MRAPAIDNQRIALLCAVGVVVLLGLAVWSYRDTVWQDVPEGYATYRGGGLEFRHPAGWEVSGDPRGTLTVRAPGRRGERLAPLILVQRYREGDAAAMQRAERRIAALVQGERLHIGSYDIDVPGADASSARSVEVKARNGKVHSLTVVTARKDGRFTAFAVRGRVTDGADNARNIAGTLRLDD